MESPQYVTIRISAKPSPEGEVFDPRAVRECLPVGKEVKFNFFDRYVDYKVTEVEEEKEGVYVTFRREGDAESHQV